MKHRAVVALRKSFLKHQDMMFNKIRMFFMVLSVLLAKTSGVNFDMGQCSCSGAPIQPPTVVGSLTDGKFYNSMRGEKGEMGRPGDTGSEGLKGGIGDTGVVGPSGTENSKNRGDSSVPLSCSDLLSTGVVESGIYKIKPRGSSKQIQVYCELNVAGGGWTLVASIHENNIHGKCTAGDRWSNEQGILNVNATAISSWEDFKTFGHPEGATSSDYKSPAYFMLTGRDVMIWHVPNDLGISQWGSSAFLQYYTNDGFLSSHGGTLRNLYDKYLPLKTMPKQVQMDGIQSLVDTLRTTAPELRNLVTGFNSYAYDNTDDMSITDGGQDMFDNGNRVFYKIGSSEYVQIKYEKLYTNTDSAVSVFSSKSLPFFMLMWVSNPGGAVGSFEIKVQSGTGADNSGSRGSRHGMLTSENLICKYHSYNVYGTADPSICELYFSCWNTESWNSVAPANFSTKLWSSNTDNLINSVVVDGSPQSILLGYTLLSRTNGIEVTQSQQEQVLMRMMQDFQATPRIRDPTCARLNESLAVPVQYIKGNNSFVKSRIPPLVRRKAEAGFIHFRPLDSEGSPNALCPGVKSLSCRPQSFCIGGMGANTNSSILEKSSCGDFSGWGGRSTDNATTEEPSGYAKSQKDLHSSILIFTR